MWRLHPLQDLWHWQVPTLHQSSQNTFLGPCHTPSALNSNVMMMKEWATIITHLMLNRSLMQMFASMISPPPPIPWIALPVRSMSILTLTAAIKDPTKKIKFAKRRIGLRPHISLSLPHTGVAAAAANMKEDPIHVYSACDALKRAAIVGTAVVMMVWILIQHWSGRSDIFEITTHGINGCKKDGYLYRCIRVWFNPISEIFRAYTESTHNQHHLPLSEHCRYRRLSLLGLYDMIRGWWQWICALYDQVVVPSAVSGLSRSE